MNTAIKALLLAVVFTVSACAKIGVKSSARSTPESIQNIAVEPLEPDVVFDEALSENLVKISLKCVDQEFPNIIGRFYRNVDQPHQVHPAFFGCYDWHSAVHGHWAMLRLLNTYPNISSRKSIEETLTHHLMAEKLGKEAAFILKNPGFEIPYGAVWYLRLAAEMRKAQFADAKILSRNLKQLENIFIDSLEKYFTKLQLPAGEGMHFNTAYALAQFWEYAVAVDNRKLQSEITAHALRLFGVDKACPIVYEPSAGDFLSACLAEAYLMSKVMKREDFLPWFEQFLPLHTSEERKTIIAPMVPADPKDYFLGHWIGAAFYKSLVLKHLAQTLPSDHRFSLVFPVSAKMQYQSGYKLMKESGYGGEHWLATFAIQASTD